ncbi:XAC2610-related protein [Ferruginibacter albus]|uniref:XAC2610-related protein n=1 Tax=Ferruginibacter albus TaxID=2875540 RepID=UPI001CC5B31A|nr:hypothetical protein [Ferruginibacter albus]UAY53028.1 hypothetical protein K9M53_04945 [Ferruginibacter albus]
MKQVFCLLILLSFISCKNTVNKTQKKVSDTVIIKHDSIASIKNDTLPRKFISYASVKVYLDSLLEAKKDLPAFEEQKLVYDTVGNAINSAIIIGNLFNPETKSAVLLYRSGDSTLNCQVFKNFGNKWIKDFESTMGYYKDDEPEPIKIQDINGDKIPDLKIIKQFDVSAIYLLEIADAWVYNGKTFTKIKDFDNIGNAEYDSINNKVCSYVSGGSGMFTAFEEYRITNNKATLLKTINCDYNYKNENFELTINNGKPFFVEGTEVYKYVPRIYQSHIKEQLKE